MKKLLPLLIVVLLAGSTVEAQLPETFAPLSGKPAPANFTEMWSGFDPRAEPLDVQTIKEWEEEDVVLRIVRFRVGVFKGQTATLAAVYGFPKSAVGSGQRLPGLVQIHGGGQYADYQSCIANAKRGYATVSIAWAGRISASQYRVGPPEVKLFWDAKTEDPNYKLTTDWGVVDGYHAPGRNSGNSFPSAKSASWTLDSIESPRNSGWFLCAIAARRALTFLERQQEVDAERLGVYGHSMGGKLTVLAAVDRRVKAAAPSCGGISDRYNDSPLFRATLGDDVSLKQISCPIVFLSPANDFHGRIGDLPDAISEISSTQWRVTCSPHGSHQDTAPFEVATLLWFDQHLKSAFEFPQTPQTQLDLATEDRVPVLSVVTDDSELVPSVDVFYTQCGKPGETQGDRDITKHRHWHHSTATHADGKWAARLPLASTEKPLWVYANARYSLDEPVSGAGYYYRQYTASDFNVSSLLMVATPAELTAAASRVTLEPSHLIEDFGADWQKEWFTYKSDEWPRATNKLAAELWKAPLTATLCLDVKAERENQLVVLLDGHAAVVPLRGGDQWQSIELRPADFINGDSQTLPDWTKTKQLKLSDTERLRSVRRDSRESTVVGKRWDGADPEFRDLRWFVTENAAE